MTALVACDGGELKFDDDGINEVDVIEDTGETGIDSGHTGHEVETGDSGEIDFDEDGFSAVVDCDDADPSVYPGAEERCNGIDDDCDGVVDGPNSVDQMVFYEDADGDGYGDLGGAVFSCEPLDGFTTTCRTVVVAYRIVTRPIVQGSVIHAVRDRNDCVGSNRAGAEGPRHGIDRISGRIGDRFVNTRVVYGVVEQVRGRIKRHRHSVGSYEEVAFDGFPVLEAEALRGHGFRGNGFIEVHNKIPIGRSVELAVVR